MEFKMFSAGFESYGIDGGNELFVKMKE